MKPAKLFMDTDACNVLGIEHYWGRVEFSSGRGQIHIRLLGITKNKAYLPAFYAAKTEKRQGVSPLMICDGRNGHDC